MDERMTLDRVRTMGRLSALLHEHGAAHAPAAAPKALVADRVLYWRNEPRLDELVSPYGTLFSEAADRAQRAIDRLWRHPPHAPHLLHGDLVPANVIVSRGVFTVIDFQDLFWGFELQDVAITIADLQRNEDPELLVEAFRGATRRFGPGPTAMPRPSLRSSRRVASISSTSVSTSASRASSASSMPTLSSSPHR